MQALVIKQQLCKRANAVFWRVELCKARIDRASLNANLPAPLVIFVVVDVARVVIPDSA